MILKDKKEILNSCDFEMCHSCIHGVIFTMQQRQDIYSGEALQMRSCRMCVRVAFFLTQQMHSFTFASSRRRLSRTIYLLIMDRSRWLSGVGEG